MQRIGRYEVEAEIGRGMDGVVYLAHDPRLRRRVAIKTFSLPQGLSDRERAEFHERFLREAQAAAGLSHSGIVTIYDADTDLQQNLSYIAMEYIPGKSLRQTLEEHGPFALDRACDAVGNLVEALQVAADAGIVHRDIKPANILIRDTDGVAKIADFGVARLPRSTLTLSGTTVGSPAYMSPEQIRGRELDGRSDLFSLGVILYEILCGRRPFTEESAEALTYSILHAIPPPITRQTGGLPSGLDGFFARALAKAPGDRFQNGEEFKEGLKQACTSVDVTATIRGRARPDPSYLESRLTWTALYVVILIGLAGLALWVGGESAEENGRTAFDPAPSAVTKPASKPETD